MTRLLKDFCDGSDDLDPEVYIGFLPDECGAALTGICESPLPALLLFSSSPLSLVLAFDCPWPTILRTDLDVVRESWWQEHVGSFGNELIMKDAVAGQRANMRVVESWAGARKVEARCESIVD